MNDTNDAPTAEVEPKPAPEPLELEVQKLLKAGEHAAAAASLLKAGQGKRAGALFEKIFEHRAALTAYEAGGAVVDAVRVAIQLGDNLALDRLVSQAIRLGQGDALLSSLQRAGRAAEEARVYAARGELVQAAASWEAAGQLDRAAAALEEIGRAREAGLLLERWLDENPRDVGAGVRLGRILARFGRHDDAIRSLQRAAAAADRPDETWGRVAATVALCFVRLGYDEAARAALLRWQKAKQQGLDVPEPPSSLEELLKSDRAAAFQAVQAGGPQGSTRPTAPSTAPPTADSFDALWGSPSSSSSSEAPPDADADVARGEEQLLLSGRYLLGEPLGGGGVGQVFRAYDAFADRPVAVKIFGQQALQSDAVKAYAKEARAVAALEHRGVARLIELNMAQGFVVTEHIAAPTLEELLRKGGDGGWLVPLTQGLLDLLSSLHRTGLVHGGLKPTNVFVPPGSVKVVDTGAHRLLALRTTETGGLSSVWPYLSPEQLFGGPASAAGDLYATAAILYRAFTGRQPFSRAEDDRRRPPPPLRTLRPELSEAWEQFFARALAPAEASRFDDAAAMLAALPPWPAAITLPASAALGAADRAVDVVSASSRYEKGGLTWREGKDVRVYEGKDLLVGRRVWLVEADDFERLRPLVTCARQWRGLQPIYDVLPEARRVVIARDSAEGRADLAALRAVPQSLTRDLAAVATSLSWLHEHGLALGGFPVERAVGPVGPRLQLAPAQLPVPASPDAIAADWDAFGVLVITAFALPDDATLDARGRLLAFLHDARLLDRADLEALSAEVGNVRDWVPFLDAVAQRLVLGAQARVVARLAARVLKG